jgi:hypothetical protein
LAENFCPSDTMMAGIDGFVADDEVTYSFRIWYGPISLRAAGDSIAIVL